MCDFFSLMYLPYIIEVTQRLSVVVNLNFKKKEDDYFFFLQKTLYTVMSVMLFCVRKGDSFRRILLMYIICFLQIPIMLSSPDTGHSISRLVEPGCHIEI